MINVTLVSRFQHLWRRPMLAHRRQPPISRSASSLASDATAAFRLNVSRPDGQTPVTVLMAQGVLDRQSCTAFLATATDLYAQGCRRLLIDLRGVTRVELAGRFALHNIARLYAGQPLLDPETGWRGLHAATNGDSTTCYHATPVLAPPTLATFLQQAALGHSLALYADRASALAACLTT